MNGHFGDIARLCFAKEEQNILGHWLRRSGSGGKYLKPAPSQRVVIEFSSPNIAKPFHVGHLRSTLLGNFLANLLSSAGYDVIRLNYLGDWGTQFGILTQWLRHPSSGVTTNLESLTLRDFYENYVKANRLASEDDTFRSAALRCFQQLELGDPHSREVWDAANRTSRAEFQRLYIQLGVIFDSIECESMFAKKANTLIQEWLEQKRLEVLPDGRIGVYINMRTHRGLERLFQVLHKSDGTTLYISRDLAAILDRQVRYAFDTILYVVGADQSKHFEAFRQLLTVFGYEDLASRLFHIGVKRVRGMSSREGSAVFVDEFLERGQKEALAFIRGFKNPKITSKNEALIANTLAVGGWLLKDFAHGRHNSMRFSWDTALSQTGDTIVYVQYAYARICSILAHAQAQGMSYHSNDLVHFNEMEAVKAMKHFEELELSLGKSLDDLDPKPLVDSLFRLVRSVNRCYNKLQVFNKSNKNVESEKTRARLAFFYVAKVVLEQTFQLLGFSALQEL